MALALAVLLVGTAVQLVPPYVTKVIVDHVLEPNAFGPALLGLVAVLLVVNQNINPHQGTPLPIPSLLD